MITLHIYSWAANPQDPYVPGDVALGHNESKQTWTLYKDLQAQAVAEGDAKPPVGITETGFSSCGGGISESLKAYRTSVYLNQLLADPTVVQTIISDITQNETPNSGGFSCIWSENNDGTAGEPTFPVIQRSLSRSNGRHKVSHERDIPHSEMWVRVHCAHRRRNVLTLA